jgi:hypothetical protein
LGQWFRWAVPGASMGTSRRHSQQRKVPGERRRGRERSSRDNGRPPSRTEHRMASRAGEGRGPSLSDGGRGASERATRQPRQASWFSTWVTSSGPRWPAEMVLHPVRRVQANYGRRP